MKKAVKPKVEILLAFSPGDRVKIRDYFDDLTEVVAMALQNPDAKVKDLEVPQVHSLFGPLTYWVMYRKLANRVSLKDIRVAIRKYIEGA